MAIHNVGAYVSDTLSNTNKTKLEKGQSISTKDRQSKEEMTEQDDVAVVVEKGKERANVTYSSKESKVDTATIERLKQEAEQRTAQLRSIVEKLLLKQSKTLTDSMDIYSLIKNGEIEVDEETRLKAQEDISEDGYWGVEQTSERLFSFAKALSGNNPEHADEMVEAFKKGYEAATEQWGGELPTICKDTYDAFLKKIEEWKSTSSTE